MSAPALARLASWVGDEGVALLRSAWSPRPLHVSSERARLDAVEDAFGGLDWERLVGRIDGDLQAWYAARATGEVTVPKEIGRRLYDAGLTIYGRLSLPLVTGALAKEIGVRSNQVQMYCFANPAGARTPAHHDRSDVVHLQVHGRKRWTIWLDECVGRPLADWVPGVASEQGRVEFVLEPGASLYVPSFWMHEVLAEDDAVSIGVAIHHTPWADRVAQSLRASLSSVARWRSSAFPGVAPRFPGWDWKELKSLLRGIEFAFQMNEASHFPLPLDRLQFNPAAHVWVERAPAQAISVELGFDAGTCRGTIRTTENRAKLIKYIACKGDSFSLHEVLLETGADAAELRDVLSILVERCLVLTPP